MAELPVLGSLLADKYRVEAVLGEGGMGTVFRARHELMDKPVAIKWLHAKLAGDATNRDRFIREAKAMARVRHANVIEVYDVGVHRGALFLVMELLEGESFEQVLQRGTMTIPRALRLLIESMRGVAAAHGRNIIHRDIKPENIFIVYDALHPDGCAKVLDFGISKLLDDGPNPLRITTTGATIGTPLYMSFEQMSGVADIDARSDVYSFGVLLYRALTGRLPFEAPFPLPSTKMRLELRPARQYVAAQRHVFPNIVVARLAHDGASRSRTVPSGCPVNGPDR
ncbi:MAG: hypothetical protein RL701_1996 [Pseudomonadota bacterium]|jgi:serine/threonine-protein kinase